MAEISLTDIKNFFGYKNLALFSADWKKLSLTEREQIRGGIGDGTYNY